MKNYNRIFIIVITAIFIGLMSITVLSNGEREEPIIFSHDLHVIENEMSCSDCHSGIMKTGLNARSMPDHDVCSDCHETDDEENCGMCHENPEEPMGMPPIPGRYEGFAHSFHNELKCNNCHGLIINDEWAMKIPHMGDCQMCHAFKDGPLECKTCHAGEKPLPVDHRLASWRMDHGLDASAGISNCGQCHTQETCDDCHQGTNLAGKPHPAGWLFNHFAEADFGGDCMVCHESREECTACHRAWLPIPHEIGPAFANDEGGDHTKLAESFIETCVSCHDIGGDDPTCAQCH